MSGHYNIVRVFGTKLDRVVGEHALDVEERMRAERFVFEVDRRRFVAMHAWMRAVLGRFMGARSESLVFARSRDGKPHVVAPRPDVRFNLSRSGNRALLAIAIGREVGVDIEEHRAIDVLGVSRSFFSSAEYLTLARLPREQRLEAFYRCWTRKESFVKARGDGLSFPLHGFEVALDDRDRQLLKACAADPDAVAQWTVLALPSPSGYSAALAVEGTECVVAGPDWEDGN